MSTTYVALSLGASETGVVTSYLVEDYSIIHNIIYKTTITGFYILTVYIMDWYITSNREGLSEFRYSLYKLIPKALVVLIILNGLYLTINNIYVIYYMI